jgi:uncharacterized membrane protein
MDKRSYVKELAYYLRSLPRADKQRILADIDDQFNIGAIDGKDEQTLILELGPPEQIAGHYVSRAESSFMNETEQDAFYSYQPKTTHLGRLLLVLIINVIFVIGPVFGFFGVLIGGWALIATGFLSPVIWGFSLLWRTPALLLTELSWLLVIVGTTLVASSLWYLLSKGSIMLIKKYSQILSDWVKG